MGGEAFLPELAGVPIDQISIETAQSALGCSILKKIPEKSIILGVLDLATDEVETAEAVAARIRRALPFVTPSRIAVAPDCGMKYLPRKVAFRKLEALVTGAALAGKSSDSSVFGAKSTG